MDDQTGKSVGGFGFGKIELSQPEIMDQASFDEKNGIEENQISDDDVR